MSTSPSADLKFILDQLKGQENPFESLVRPQRLDESFRDLHVPELLQEERDVLFQLIDYFRVKDYHKAADLPSTRSVIVVGERGAGKTHLLQSLRYSSQSFLLASSQYYNQEIPIEEFLLSQITAALFEESELFEGKPIDDLAQGLTRRLLRQALLSASATDRIFAIEPTRWQRYWLFATGGNAIYDRAEKCATALASNATSKELAALAQSSGFSPSNCLRLVTGHLNRLEGGHDLIAQVRRGLYQGMARRALLGDEEALRTALSSEHLPAGAGARRERTTQVLHAVIEVCALFQMPIVLAFDNFEALFRPRGETDPELVRAFFDGLAHAVDNSRGILILVFVEQGMLQRELVPNIREFARMRMTQGVPLPGRNPVHQINIKRPGLEVLRKFVNARMRSSIAKIHSNSSLPPEFPFQPEDLQIKDLATLRNAIVHLRDRYSLRVYGEGNVPQPDQPARPTVSLEEVWRLQQTRTQQRLQTSTLTALLKDFHAGLGALLQNATPLEAGGWRLSKIEGIVTVGESVNYGVVTVTEWEHVEEAGVDPLRVGMGLLLGIGKAMAVDLHAKFDALRSRTLNLQGLIIGWPTQKEAARLEEALPEKTRAEWDSTRLRSRAQLCRLDENDVSTFATCLTWLGAVRDQVAPSQLELQKFLDRECRGLLEVLRQAMLEITATGATHENGKPGPASANR